MSILGHLRRRPSLSHHSLKTSDGEYDDDDDEGDDEDDADNYNNEVDEDDMDNKDEEDGSDGIGNGHIADHNYQKQ